MAKRIEVKNGKSKVVTFTPKLTGNEDALESLYNKKQELSAISRELHSLTDNEVMTGVSKSSKKTALRNRIAPLQSEITELKLSLTESK